MLREIEFHNYKALRDTTLPLGPFTLLVGPNGSGKSTAMEALLAAGSPGPFKFAQIASAGGVSEQARLAKVTLRWEDPFATVSTTACWWPGRSPEGPKHTRSGGPKLSETEVRLLTTKLGAVRVYSLDAHLIAAAVDLEPKAELGARGANLAAVLTQLQDQYPERFEALNEALGEWFPEFDRLLFGTPAKGRRAFLLRTRKGRHVFPAWDLSQGTLLALFMLALAYLRKPPPLVCLEEPDRGIHPRLLRDVQDALYRLSYPEKYGEKRKPVQVLATTHSPYMLDLYRDHPEEIVIANKKGLDVTFERLSDRADVDDILQSAPLGEVWYTGVLGGVPGER